MEETYEDFDYFLFTALMDTRDYLFSIIQNRNVPIEAAPSEITGMRA